MKCLNCKNFNPSVEAGKELSPNMKAAKGKCSIDDKACMGDDKCGCGGFDKK